MPPPPKKISEKLINEALRYITVAPAEDIDKVVQSSIFSMNKVEEIQKPAKEKDKKRSDERQIQDPCSC